MDVDTMVGTELLRLRRRRPEVTGGVLAGTDGMVIGSDLPGTDATHLAALAAAGFGVASRVAATVRRGEFREAMVCTATGTVVTYPAGQDALLTLVADSTDDLEGLHAEARAVAHRAGSALDARPRVTAPALDARAPHVVTTTLPRRTGAPTWRRPPIR
ncbi:roadblock/LC7 domain-containing protein [Micromonospora sp. WMMA1363]|uniref:roadblock/LC7 domain-containing protein n=1 Tax=Micromonospora sp. WMMA1363 TaxID=3053985 RepID=UPI00259C6D47|nr:roadblock/LC7 domain-containing protein [Micromonospora sp. WMMA1363]MDM4720258.1 roadblock/LC7 domain-containing protein [Micromonospora sp. WMMA1363]